MATVLNLILCKCKFFLHHMFKHCYCCGNIFCQGKGLINKVWVRLNACHDQKFLLNPHLYPRNISHTTLTSVTGPQSSIWWFRESPCVCIQLVPSQSPISIQLTNITFGSYRTYLSPRVKQGISWWIIYLKVLSIYV